MQRFLSYLNNPLVALQANQAASQLTSLIISVILAKWIVDTEVIGIYELLVFLGFIFSYFWFTGLMQGFLRKMNTDPQSLLFSTQLFNLYLLTLGLNTVIFGLLYFGQEWLIPILTGFQSIPWLGWYTLFMVFIIPTGILPYVYYLQNQVAPSLIFTAFVTIAKIIAFIIPIFWGGDLEDALINLCIVGLVVHLYVLLKLNRLWQYRFQSIQIRVILLSGLPLIGYAVLGALAQAVDAFIVNGYYHDESIFAIFRYGSKELPFVGALTGAVAAGALPLLGKNWQHGMEWIRQESVRLHHILFVGSIITIWISPWVFPLIFNDSFVTSAFLYNTYLFTLINRVWFAQTVLMSLNKNRMILGIAIFELLINIGLSIWWVSIFGLLGIAFATVIAFLTEKIIMSIYLAKSGIKLNSFLPVRLTILYGLLMIISYLVTTYVYG